jgi:hypothetical protein
VEAPTAAHAAASHAPRPSSSTTLRETHADGQESTQNNS